MRVHIIGAFTPANLGDGAIVLRMIDESRRVFGDDSHVTLSATDPEAFRSLLGVAADERPLVWVPLGTWAARTRWILRNATTATLLWTAASFGRPGIKLASTSRLLPSSARTALKNLLEAELVLAAGGGYLSDPYRKQFPFWYLEYKCARAAGAKLIFFSQSFGPATKRLSRYFLSRSLRCASLFIARDQLSAANIREFGTPVPLATCPDVALTTERVQPMDHGGPVIGVSLLRWANFHGDAAGSHDAYMNAVQRALESLLSSDAHLGVRLYATNSMIGRNAMDDVSVCVEMHSRLERAGLGDRCTTVPWTAQPAEFSADVGGCELLIASRMHSAVLALAQGTPVAGIAYEEKMVGLLDMFGLGDHTVSIEDPEGIGAMIQRAWAATAAMRSTVVDRLLAVQTDAGRAMELCSDVVAGRSIAS